MEATLTASTPISEAPAVGAGFGRRLAARLIDLVVHYIVWFATGAVVGFIIGIYAVLAGIPVDPLVAKLQTAGAAAYVAAMLGALFYFAACEGLHGATLGKLMLGMHVVSENGDPCSLGSAFMRSLGFHVDQFFFGLVAYQSMRSSSRQQRLGDKWARTVVIERSKYTRMPFPSGWRFAGAFLVGIAADALMFIVATLINLG